MSNKFYAVELNQNMGLWPQTSHFWPVAIVQMVWDRGMGKGAVKSLDGDSWLGKRQLWYQAWWWVVSQCWCSSYRPKKKKLPDWPLGITPNSLVSILTTILKSSLLFAVGEGLGQQKWVWCLRLTKDIGHLMKRVVDLGKFVADLAHKGNVSVTSTLKTTVVPWSNYHYPIIGSRSV